MISLALILTGLLLAKAYTHVAGVNRDDATTWFMLWLLITSAAFLSGHFIAFSICLAIVIGFTRKRMLVDVPVLYAVLLPLMPTFKYVIPGALGINKIVTLDYPRVLALALLIPAYLGAKANRRLGSRSLARGTIDFFVIGYCVWLCVVTLAHTVSITDSLRTIVEIVAFMLLPYLAISRLIASREQIIAVISAIAFSGLIVSAVCVIEVLANRHLYLDLVTRLHTEPIPGLSYLRYYRFGMLRVRGTMEGGLGLFLVLALGALLCVSRLKSMPLGRTVAGATMMLIPIVLTGSRGTWIMTGMLLTVFFGFRFFNTPKRFSLAALAVLLGIPVIKELILGIRDEFGTFDYREQLLESALPMIGEKPILGWGSLPNLYATGRLDHLIQGEGIIDMVNTYLSEALTHGLPALFLFVGALVTSILVPLSRLTNAKAEDARTLAPIVAWVCAILPAGAFLLVTTSIVGHTWVYLSLVLGICSSLAAVHGVGQSTQGRRSRQP